MKQDKALAMIGLAQKAGKIVSGEFATEKAVKTGKAALVIVAGDDATRLSRYTKATPKQTCRQTMPRKRKTELSDL